MESTLPVTGDRQSSRTPAGASRAMTARSRCDTVFEILRSRRDDEALTAQLQGRKQKLENLHEHRDELLEEFTKAKEQHSSFDTSRKDQETDQTLKKAEKEKREASEKDAEIGRLKEAHAELRRREQDLHRELQRNSLHWDFMQQVVKITKFESVQTLVGHLESLLHTGERLSQKENEVQRQADLQRKALVTLEDQHHLLLLHKNNQLSQLQTCLEKTRSEAEVWEKKWNHIQETAAKKTLLLGLIKMASLTLYELSTGEMEGEEGVAMSDTETQLEKIKIFIQDHDDIVKQYQTTWRRNESGQSRDRKHRQSC